MKKCTELQALPSELVWEDGSRSVLEELPEPRKERFYRRLKKNLEEQLKYMDDPIL